MKEKQTMKANEEKNKNDFNTNLFNLLKEIKSVVKSVKTDSTNPHFKNKYASLNAILEDVEPIIEKHNFFIIYVQNDYTLELRLIHFPTGETITTNAPLINAIDMQKLGSAITYARRYLLVALLNLRTEIDDDGNEATNVVKKAFADNKQQTKPYVKPNAPVVNNVPDFKIDPALKNEILTLWKDTQERVEVKDPQIALRINTYIKENFVKCDIERLDRLKTYLLKEINDISDDHVAMDIPFSLPEKTT